MGNYTSAMNLFWMSPVKKLEESKNTAHGRFSTDVASRNKMGYAPIFYIASVFYPVLGAVGIPVNLTAIVILSRGKCGLSKCITRYLLGMATADLMVVICVGIVEQSNYIHHYADFLLITPICSMTNVLRVATIDCSVWITVALTFDRYIAICCHKLRDRYCTEKTASVVIVIVVIASCARATPFYFALEPEFIISNVPWHCVTTYFYNTSSFWKGYELLDSILTPLVPIVLFLVLNGLTVRHIIEANKVRRGLRGNIGDQRDEEAANRRRSMILLFAISANFISFWMPYLIYSLTWQAQNYSYTDRYLNTPTYILQQFAYMFEMVSMCTNTCIYGLTQRKFRQELKNGLKYLFTLNGKLCS